jgi:hypothetical protein
VVVCKTQPGHAEEGFGQQALDTLFERLSKTHPAFVYDGRELKGDEVRLYLLSDEAWSLAASLARALSELNAYRGSLVLVCSDLGERLGEYAVS